MAEYQVTQIKKDAVTSTGKSYKIVDMTDENTTLIPDVKIWGDFDDGRIQFTQIAPMSMIMGDVKVDPKWGASISPSRPASLNPQFGRGGGKTAAVAKAMEAKNEAIAGFQDKKAESISKFQDNKEYGMRLASTMRDAVALSIAEGKPTKENILVWRKWLWNSYENITNDTYPPFDGEPAF